MNTNCLHILVFFFQAEDGIRDADVTGVQTCALPIWSRHGRRAASAATGCARRGSPSCATGSTSWIGSGGSASARSATTWRGRHESGHARDRRLPAPAGAGLGGADLVGGAGGVVHAQRLRAGG